MIAEFETQICLHNRLPRGLRVRLFGHMDQGVADIAESLAQRLKEQLVLALEVFVKASVCQTSVAHNRCNCCAVKALGAHASRGVFDNLLMDFRCVFWPITHSSS